MRRGAWLACAVLLALSPAVARGSMFVQLTLAELAQRAARVAEVEATAARVEQFGGAPSTVVTCRVKRMLKGEAAQSLLLRVPGGRQGELTMTVPGAPIPEIGDIFVVALEPDGSKASGQIVYRPVGLGQGLFSLVERDGQTWAVQRLADAPRQFAECLKDTADCRRDLHVLALPREEFAAALQSPR